MRSVPTFAETMGKEVKVLHNYSTNKGRANDGAHWFSADPACAGSRDPSQHHEKAKRTSLQSDSCLNTTAMCGMHSDVV